MRPERSFVARTWSKRNVLPIPPRPFHAEDGELARGAIVPAQHGEKAADRVPATDEGSLCHVESSCASAAGGIRPDGRYDAREEKSSFQGVGRGRPDDRVLNE